MGWQASAFLSTRTSGAAAPREASQPSSDPRISQSLDGEFAISYLVSTV